MYKNKTLGHKKYRILKTIFNTSNEYIQATTAEEQSADFRKTVLHFYE